MTTSPLKLFPKFPAPPVLTVLERIEFGFTGELGDEAISIESPLVRTFFAIFVSIVEIDL